MNICNQYQITRITLVPSLLRELLVNTDDNHALLQKARKIPHWEVTGEAFQLSLAEKFKQLISKKVFFLDCYGATEATSVLYRDFSHSKGSQYKIRSLWNTSVHLLDENLNPVPNGCVGEICLGGIGLARGYLNQPCLTAEKFIPNPLSQDGSRLYRSGDLARYHSNGRKEFLGRTDYQTKLRGFRVDLCEIEMVIGSINNIREVAVLARENHPHQKKLVA